MDSREQMKGFYPELFPKDYPERLERLVELIGLTWGSSRSASASQQCKAG